MLLFLLGTLILTLIALATVSYRYNKLTKQLHQISLDTRQTFEQELKKKLSHKEQLIEQSRLVQMGEMVSMIAHQWRQPLGAIASTAIGIETKIRLNKFDFTTPIGRKEIESYLLGRTELIAKYVNTLTTTIDDFRTFYQKDKLKQLTSIQPLISRAVGIIEGAFQEKGIQIDIDVDPQSKLLLYPNEVVQVLLNILQNAYDQFNETENHTPHVSISAHKIDDIVHIEIIDNAGGIPKEILPKIFHPYFSTKYQKNGTGIGLYMSKIIIEDHHKGSLDAFSSPNGACFVIQLPYEKSIQ